MVEIRKGDLFFQFKIVSPKPEVGKKKIETEEDIEKLYEPREVIEAEEFSIYTNDMFGEEFSWLTIEINVNNGEFQWKQKDPSITTLELVELIYWLSTLGEGKSPDPRVIEQAVCFNTAKPGEPKKWNGLTFKEQLLNFSYERKDNNTTLLRITFEGELRPIRSRDEWEKKYGDKECFIEFELTNEELLNIAKMFEEEGKEFIRNNQYVELKWRRKGKYKDILDRIFRE